MAESQSYLPSTVEKKRVMTYFVFLGLLMLFVTHRSLSVYERYYAQVMIGWWSCMFLSFVVAIVALLIPVIAWIYILYLLLWIVIRVGAMMQAWQGGYDVPFPFYRFLGGIGGWILAIFDITIESSPQIDPSL